nr:site-specific integrase [Anaerolinea sp.]
RAVATVEGRRISKTFTTQKAAGAWLRETTLQAEQGMGYDAARTRLGEFMDAWMATKTPGLRMATIESYSAQIRLYIKPKIGNLKMREVTAARIQSFYDGLLADGKGKRTVEIAHMVLHGALEHARRIGLLANNPAELVQVPRPEKREMSVWNENQVSQFLVHVDGDPLYRLAFFTGMRRGELLGLKWSDLDWKTGMLQIRRQVYRMARGGWRFQEPKTARGKRAIRLGPALLAALREHYMVTIPMLMSLAGEAWQEYDLIFPSRKGNPLIGSEVSKHFRGLAREAGLPAIRFHDIRHTCASLLLSHREPAVRVAAMLGQSVQILLETYAHYIPEDSESAAVLMNEITTPAMLPEMITRKVHAEKGG